MTFLLTLWGWKNWILGGAIALAVGGAWLYVQHLQDEVLVLEKSLDRAVDAAKANADAVITMQQESEKVLVSIGKDRNRAVARAKALEKVLKDVESAPPSDDGPLAPVLERTVDWLRSVSPSPGQDPSGQVKGPIQPVDL